MLVGWLREGAEEDGRELPEEPARMSVSLITSAVRLQVVFGITCGLSREELVHQLSTALHRFVDTACSETADRRGDVGE